MADFAAQPTTMRDIPGVGQIEQSGCYATVAGRVGQSIITAEMVAGNQQHYFRTTYPQCWAMMQSGEAAAFVLTEINGKPAQVRLSPAEFAKGAPERARYAAWMAGVIAERDAGQTAERAFDSEMNEGGEGYNPHRTGSERTYARQPRRERDYPAGA